MNREERIQKLVEMGGSEWEKFNGDGTHYHRVYFDAMAIAKLAGYDWLTYQTGNISSAVCNGHHISNSEMGRVLASLDAKFWYDVVTGKFMEKGAFSLQPEPKAWQEVVTILQNAIREEK